jgi:periplasmic divalent cation tolerance protein
VEITKSLWEAQQMNHSFVQILTTTDRREVAERIAHELVEKHLAACVQIVGPIRSIYWWQGAVEEADEWQCLIKTRSELIQAVIEGIRQAHNYQVPEIIVFPIIAGNPEYLAWLAENTQSQAAKEA